MYKVKWDLQEIYKTEADFYKDFDTVRDKLSKINVNCFTDGGTLCNYLMEDDKISKLMEKIYSYASLRSDLDISDSASLELKEKALDLYREYEKVTSFFVPTFLSLEKEVIDSFYHECDGLLEYKILLDRIYRYKEHTLSEIEEKLLSKVNSVFDRSSQTYRLLTDSDITFGKIEDEDGNLVELTDSNYQRFVQSSNREIRRNSFMMLHDTYARFANTIASTYYSKVNELKVMSEIKKYNSILDMVVFGDELDKSIYKNLVEVINRRMNAIYSYFKMKKDYLKIDDFHLYDAYAPLSDSSNFTYNYEEAVGLVLKALKPLGDDYLNILEEGYKSGWVDVYPAKAKRSGAYSSGCFLTKPYMLLNFENTYNDVSTLAHESGHSMHSYYTIKNNNYCYASYKIFVAEVASTVNELLFSKYMLENTDNKEEKIFILDKLMNLYKATIFRQTMFAEFEEKSYSLVEQGVPLTSDLLKEEYYKLNKKYFGDEVVIDEEIKYEWLRIPHFYYNFYVYKYATGLSCATYIVKNIENKSFRDKYLEMLKVGETKNPLETLKVAGVDITKPEVIESAIDYFEEIQKEFIELVKPL